MATDQLGVIANKHIILADQRSMGTVDPGTWCAYDDLQLAYNVTDCIHLAELHSTDIDYSKTGIPVDMSLLRKMRTTKYRPDLWVIISSLHIEPRLWFQWLLSSLKTERNDKRSKRRHLWFPDAVINSRQRHQPTSKTGRKFSLMMTLISQSMMATRMTKAFHFTYITNPTRSMGSSTERLTRARFGTKIPRWKRNLRKIYGLTWCDTSWPNAIANWEVYTGPTQKLRLGIFAMRAFSR